MEKPKFITEERRDGIMAVVFAGRFALPSWLVVLILLGSFAAIIVTGIIGIVTENKALQLPLEITALLGVLILVGTGVSFVIRQIIRVNRKDLPSDRD